jgi:hypothetical protein
MKSLLAILIVLASCKSQIASQKIHGNFYKHGGDYIYELRLRSDSTFLLTQQNLDVSQSCEGKWNCLSNDTILLRCFDEKDLITQLSSGYMPERENKVVVLSSKKIKLGQLIMRKTH